MPNPEATLAIGNVLIQAGNPTLGNYIMRSTLPSGPDQTLEDWLSQADTLGEPGELTRVYAYWVPINSAGVLTEGVMRYAEELELYPVNGPTFEVVDESLNIFDEFCQFEDLQFVSGTRDSALFHSAESDCFWFLFVPQFYFI